MPYAIVMDLKFDPGASGNSSRIEEAKKWWSIMNGGLTPDIT
jgi:hypothetical protein